jgi:hypothetical protein
MKRRRRLRPDARAQRHRTRNGDERVVTRAGYPLVWAHACLPGIMG